MSDPQPPTVPGDKPTPALKSMRALDPPTVPFAIGGMIVWLIAWLVIYLGFRDDHPSWPAICVAGFLLGFPGLAIMIVHDRHRRQRRDQNGSERSDSRDADRPGPHNQDDHGGPNHNGADRGYQIESTKPSRTAPSSDVG